MGIKIKGTSEIVLEGKLQFIENEGGNADLGAYIEKTSITEALAEHFGVNDSNEGRGSHLAVCDGEWSETATVDGWCRITITIEEYAD